MQSEQPAADAPEPLLEQAYSPEAFRAAGHRIIDMLADHLQASTAGEHEQALPWIEPDAAVKQWSEFARETRTIEEICRDLLAGSVHISDPKYLGHQICYPVPAAMLAGLMTDCLNNGSGIYEMGMAGTAMEKYVVATVARRFGMDEGADGFLTSGGTLANLTAMLAARSVKSPDHDWIDGTSRTLAVMVSSQSHYCIDRAIRIMGWGDAGLIRVPVDERFCMRVDLLPELLDDARRGGKHVIGVVGSACTTSTGSFDDLVGIADFCGEHDLWFHVDGAHGAAVAFADAQRDRVRGIERADSVTLDFHKMLMTPVTTSALVFRRGEDGFRTFATEADYLFERDAEQDWFNLAKRTFECTKMMMVTRFYSILALHGEALLAANIDRLFRLTSEFVSILQSQKRFELATEPQCNIICFRHLGKGERAADISRLNAQIRASLTKAGKFYIVQTTLRGETWLRTTITNPFTTPADFHALLEEIEKTVGALA